MITVKRVSTGMVNSTAGQSQWKVGDKVHFERSAAVASELCQASSRLRGTKKRSAPSLAEA